MNTVFCSQDELYFSVEKFINQVEPRSVIGLSGVLGSGKTTFVRTCIDWLARKKGLPSPIVKSPTFVLHQSYLYLGVEHFDLYRLEKVSEQGLTEIGYYDSVNSVLKHKGYLFVEWPENVQDETWLELKHKITIEIMGDNLRRYQFS